MKSIVLSGFMATGNSTVARALAARLGLPLVDTDDEIEKLTKKSIADLWRDEGEPKFRAREHDLVKKLLADPSPRVLAFGGGTVTNRETRHLALDRALVVTLTASPETSVDRAGPLENRPNLAFADPVARAKELIDARAAAYAECHLSLATDGISVDAIVDAIVPLSARAPIAMPLGARSYVVDVVDDHPDALTDAVAKLAPSSLVVVTDSNVHRARGKALHTALDALAVPWTELTLAPGESYKNIASVGAIWDAALGANADRDSVIVAFGGGVVGDLAGFAASSLLRGVRFVGVPTTLLSMVDASVGGKTGFDHPAGKNLIGSFHQPSAVVADLAHLATLPARDLACGFAEIVKIALTRDADFFERIESTANQAKSGDRTILAEYIRRSIELKAEVVRDDEREAGDRAILNFGHTVGHALEAHGGYAKHRHGEAVAIGMLVELALGAELGFAPKDLLARTRGVLEKLGLPTSVPHAELEAAWSYINSDKKRSGKTLKLPLPSQLGRAEVHRVPVSSLVLPKLPM
ncbi:MAG: 3-dehydroquinate synthase [Polyangiaceae bacterium]